MKAYTSLARRHLLTGTGSALAAIGLGSWTTSVGAQSPAAKPLPSYAAWKSASTLIQHSANTLETRRSAFGSSVITPANQLYVRNNLPTPDASILDDRDAWTLELSGVKQARSLRLAELKTLGLETVATVLQCSGNGRGFFDSKPSGTPWTVGAAGCVLWSGVPLRAVVAHLGGLEAGVRFITGTGGEKLPEGVDVASVVVERSVPLAGLDDAMLAWEMNGEPLSLAHGGPLRLIVPGYQGVNNIKYVKRLAFTAQESTAKIMSHGYRMTPPGTKSAPDQPSVLEMGVKSFITAPLPESGKLAGALQIVGVAFGGTRAVKGVEVSTDGGKRWQAARWVGPDLGRFAWRQFVLPVNLPAGTHTLMSRATDAAGRVQPELREENLHGYNNTSWRDHAVTITLA